MYRIFILFLVLALFWIALSGEWSPLLLTMGLLSCLLVVYLNYRMRIIDDEGIPTHIHPIRLFNYALWLVKEIFKSNIAVTKIALSKKLDLQPQIFRLNADELHDVSQVIYANSITMTPGTVSIDLGKDWIEVHALTHEAAESLREGEMYRRVKALDL